MDEKLKSENMQNAGARPEYHVWGLEPRAGRAREREPITGSLGAQPPAGSRGKAPGQGIRGAKPPEAENILAFGCATEAANLPHSARTLTLSK